MAILNKFGQFFATSGNPDYYGDADERDDYDGDGEENYDDNNDDPSYDDYYSGSGFGRGHDEEEEAEEPEVQRIKFKRPLFRRRNETFREEEEELREEPRQTAPRRTTGGSLYSLSGDSRAQDICVIRPHTGDFSKKAEYADYIKQRRVLLIDFEKTDKATKTRLILFLSGVAFAMDATLFQVNENGYCIAPLNCTVSGEYIRSLFETYSL